MAAVAERCALITHEDCGRHDTGWGHPEHQGRLPAVMRALEQETPALLPHLVMREAQPVGESALLRVHTRRHIETVRALAEQAAESDTLITVDSDTVISAASRDAALAAAGCAVDAAAMVARGETRTAFALCRPPGHHATPERIMGFCLFNNAAVAARAAQQEHGVDRVLIIDWDVHHGNGTQEIFWEDPSVYYLSLHQFPWYPGTGLPEERGGGPGLGTTRNVPIAAETPRATYRECFRNALDATFEEFEPDLILISAGYDCMAGDPLGRLLLEPEDLHGMTREVLERSNGRVAVVLEGGYAPERLGAGMVATVRALCGLGPAD